MNDPTIDFTGSQQTEEDYSVFMRKHTEHVHRD